MVRNKTTGKNRSEKHKWASERNWNKMCLKMVRSHLSRMYASKSCTPNEHKLLDEIFVPMSSLLDLWDKRLVTSRANYLKGKKDDDTK